MKLKTHSGAKKRIKVTSTGKLLHKGAATSHLLTHKEKHSKKQHHKFSNAISKADEKNIRRLLPYSK